MSVAEKVIAGDLVDMEWSPDGVAWAEIPGCKTVGIPEENPEYRDRTALDSPGRTREYGVGLTDVSELTLSCFYTKELYAQAVGYKAAAKPVYFRAVLPSTDGQSSGDEFEYKAYVNPTTPSVDVDGDLMTDLKLRPTGQVTWTEGNPA